MPVASSICRRAATVLAFALPCLLLVSTADASPVRKAHGRTHRAVTRRVVTAKQAFARLASRRPERRVVRHPLPRLKGTHGTPDTRDHDAAIQASGSPASTAPPHDAPSLEPLELLLQVQAQLPSHDGFAPSSPRAPPVHG